MTERLLAVLRRPLHLSLWSLLGLLVVAGLIVGARPTGTSLTVAEVALVVLLFDVPGRVLLLPAAALVGVGVAASIGGVAAVGVAALLLAALRLAFPRRTVG